MKHPLFNVDFSRLNIKYPPNLLPEDKLMSLRQEFVTFFVEFGFLHFCASLLSGNGLPAYRIGDPLCIV